MKLFLLEVVTVFLFSVPAISLSQSVPEAAHLTDSQLTLLQKLDNVIKAEEASGNHSEKMHELKTARKEYTETLKTIEQLRQRIVLLHEKIEARDNKKHDVLINNDPDDSRLIYTIQTGSFRDLMRARKQYHSLSEMLSEESNDHLRIEKIGKVYSVRVGSFTAQTEASNFLRTVSHQLDTAYILEAFIKKDRIIKCRDHFIVSTQKEL